MSIRSQSSSPFSPPTSPVAAGNSRSAISEPAKDKGKQVVRPIDSTGPPLSALGSHPLLFTPARLPICVLQQLTRFPGLPRDADLFLLSPGGHPIRRVEIMGLVVGVDIKTALVIHSVDDGTGIVPVVTQIPKEKQNATEPPKTFDIGTLVKAMGLVTDWNSGRKGKPENWEMQIKSFQMTEEEAGAEVVWWLQVVELDRDVYSKPWDVLAGLRAGTAGTSAPT